MIEDLRLALTPAPEDKVFSTEAIVLLQHRMSERQELSRSTAAAHAASLADSEGRILTVKEDVGRHNAMDKAIGYGMQNGVDFGRCMMLLSGRISFEMVQKALRAGIPPGGGRFRRYIPFREIGRPIRVHARRALAGRSNDGLHPSGENTSQG